MKVVINKCYGGFSISKKAAEFMASRGNELAIQALADRKGNFHYDSIHVMCNDDFEFRTNLDLITAVEILGDEANGECAKLKIIEIPDGVEYVIEEYDGMEHVAEKHKTWS